MTQLFASGGQSIGASALASVLPVNVQGWSLVREQRSDKSQNAAKKRKKKINEINNVYPVFFKAICLGFKMQSESHKSTS